MMPSDLEGRSIGQLLRDLADDVTQLIRNELALARSEASDNASKMVTALVSIAATTPAAAEGAANGRFTVSMSNAASTDTVLKKPLRTI